MSGKETAKVTKIQTYRRPLQTNIGVIIFAVIFIYVCICVTLFFKENHIKPYEVREGSLAADNMYTGVIIRDEIIVSADTAGYINYYAREGERVAVGNLVYTLDETGQLSDYVSNAETNENTLSQKQLAQIKSDLEYYVKKFNLTQFASTYDLKYDLQGTVLKIANNSLLENITDLANEFGGLIQLEYAPHTGIVMYWTDGYETLSKEEITKETFNFDKYERLDMMGNDLVSKGDAVYKVCNNENWSIVIPIDKNRVDELIEAEYVKVRFVKNQKESWGKVEIIEHGEEYFASLSFTNSMLSFVNDRFLEIELMLNNEMGLKIPNSAIVEREFFLIPEEYVTQSGEKGSYGVLRETVLENGMKSSEYVSIGIYSMENGEYYVDAGVLKSGDHLYKPDSTENYTVSKRATLIGVFNMNKGYADFRQIDILYQNNEYAIVKSNTKYGLNVYDLIVQNASSVKTDQFIYK